MKEFSRRQRVAEFVQRELARMLREEMRDPRTDRVGITRVGISRDIAFADVYFTLPEATGTEGREAALSALNGAQGFLRRLLAQELRMRVTPRLRFHHDEAVEREFALGRLIDSAVAEDSARASGAAAARRNGDGA